MSEENKTLADDTILNSSETENQTTDSEITEAAEAGNEITDVSFEDLGLDEYALKAVERKGFVTPSPIQVLAIPRLLNGDTNLIARARTGTGKTAAFGLPIIQCIREKSDTVQALILEPTRELAMQTCTEMQSFSTEGIPRTTVLYGGASYATQIRELKRGCEIVVGTPGRIKDHLERRTLDLKKIKYFILDEGDEMLDMGFIDDIREIFAQANPDARILLFSATMPPEILKIAADFMGEYDIIEEEKVIDEALAIDQKYWVVREAEKIEALVRLIDMSPDFYGIVFTQTKMDADNVTRQLDLRGYEAAALHGDIMQNQREKVIERFRMKKTRILVATDVAARGIDISGLSHVVNYSLPFDAATYVHRIGRTGRAGAEGIAVTFVRPEERRKLGFMQKAVAKASKGEMKEEKIPSVNQVLTIKEERLIEELKSKLFVTEEENMDEEAASESFSEENIAAETAADSNTGTAETEAESKSTEVTSAENEADSENAAAATEAENDNNVEDSETYGEAEEKAPQLREIPKKYLALAQSLTEQNDATEVLASVLSVFYGDKLSPKHYGKISETRNFAPRGDQLRIFISLGKKDGYRAKEIADYFSSLLHIPSRMVDGIDVAQQFSLVSLPAASAKKAIEMSKSDRSLPHMHFDAKEEGGSRRGGSRGERRERRSGSGDFSEGRGSRGRRERGDKSGDREHDFGRNRDGGRENRRNFDSRDGRKSGGSRPNVHSQTQRSSKRSTGGASAFVKKSGKAERF